MTSPLGGDYQGWQGLRALYSPHEQRLLALASLLSIGGLAAAVKVAKTLSLFHQDSHQKGDQEEEEEEEEVVAAMGPLKYVLYGLRYATSTTGGGSDGGGEMLLAGVEGRRKRSRLSSSSLPSSSYPHGSGRSKHATRKQVAVDRDFLIDLWRLVRVLIPSWRSPEARWVLVMVVLLAARTACDMRMIRLVVNVEKSLVEGNRRSLLRNFFRFVRFMVPVACITSMLKYTNAEVALRFDQRLSSYLHHKYLSGLTFYKVTMTTPHVEQLLTQDVMRFCRSLTDVTSNLLKPVIDIGVYTLRLRGSVGVGVPATLALYLLTSGALLTAARRPVADYTNILQEREGEYRHLHSRLCSHSEEIAFYRGAAREKITVTTSLLRLIRAERRSALFRSSLDVVEAVVAKYLATALGWLLLSRHLQTGERYRDFHQASRMMMNLAQAMASLVSAGREVTKLATYTARVSRLERVLDAADTTTTSQGEDGSNGAAPSGLPRSSSSLLMLSSLEKGVVVEDDSVIEFDEVPLRTPSGQVLVHSLSFRVEAGHNVLCAGPNGSGKSSLFRTLAGLWPLQGGRLTRPPPSHIFYIPQKPYLSLGTLRDQVLYPDVAVVGEKRGCCSRDTGAGRADDALVDILKVVQLEYLVTRWEGGWDTVCDWNEVLSGGEKQRLAMARLFYHRPRFAILDECTSAVSVDVEGAMYTYCKKLNITLFTVSHRRSLWQYHDYLLRFEGKGGRVLFQTIADVSPQDLFGS